MSKDNLSFLQRAFETLGGMLSEDRESVIELVRHRVREQRRQARVQRDEIARNAASTLQAVREKRESPGTSESLGRWLPAAES